MTWEQVGRTFRSSPKRYGGREDAHERCEGCGLDATKGTLRNVIVDRDAVAGTDYRTNGPIYRLEAFKALCLRCRKDYE